MRRKKKPAKEIQELPSIQVDIECLEEGMRAAKDICNSYGTPIVRRKRKIEGKHISQFRLANIKTIDIWDEEHDAESKKPSEPAVHIDDYPEHLNALAKSRILVIEDSKAARMVIRFLIEDAGLKVIGEATGGQDGIQKARELKPNVITLDLNMPDIDGITALPQIIEAAPGAKVIVISSLGYKDRIVEALELGAVQFVTKPFSHKGLQKVIIKTIIGPQHGK